MAAARFNLAAIFRKRDDLLENAIFPFITERLEGPRVDELAKALSRRLPSGAGYDAIFESVRYLAGHELHNREAQRLAWRLAGNLPRLREGKSVLPWASQATDEWMPFEVLRGIYTKNKYHKKGYEFTFRILAGSGCPLKVQAFWSINVASFIARQIGFSKPWGSFPFQHPMQLVGLRFYGLVEAARSRGAPEFHEVTAPASLIKWNRDNVLRLRLRVGVLCPNGWQHECHKCAVGYNRCCAATHLHDYVRQPCTRCGEEAVFDPEESLPYCISCCTKQRFRRA